MNQLSVGNTEPQNYGNNDSIHRHISKLSHFQIGMKGLLFYITLFLTHTAGAQFYVAHLQCEYREDPLGVETMTPKLSWQIQSNQKNVLQTAYRILVADNVELLKKDNGNIWDSKKTSSATSQLVPYKGKQLVAAKKYYWKVMIWDNQGNVYPWSATAIWQMGLPAREDWSAAKWIAYEEINDTAIIVPHMHQGGKKAWGSRRNVLPLFRKNFSIRKTVRSATTFISGLGHFELSVNGKKVGDHFLDPGWTNYAKHAQYVTFDITDKLKPGVNVLGVMLGNGFYYIPGQRYRKMTGAYGLPKLIAKTVIEYTDGSSDIITSDGSWRTAPSPIIFSSIFGGEDYDAQLEQENWNASGFDDASWKPAIITSAIPLESQMAEPVKVMKEFPEFKLYKNADGSRTYDMLQNLSGIPSISVTGNVGDTVRIIPAELINEDGSVNQRASGSPSYFTYILKGNAVEEWRPRFSYYGFRYLQIFCIPRDTLNPRPQCFDVKVLHISNAAPALGYVGFSSGLFNNIVKLIDWSIRSNMTSVYTDCPHREKLGWLEETHLMCPSIHFKYDIAALNRKVIRDMMMAQYENGKMPEIAPEYVRFTPPFDESTEWGSAAIILPWYNYKWYGDKETLISSYDMMKRYIMYLRNVKDTNYILTHGLGDWYDLGPNRPGFAQMTRMGVTATATYYHDLMIMQDIAKLLNKPGDQKFYKELAGNVKTAFNKRFFDPLKMEYDSGSQTANAMALHMGLVEEKNKKAVLDALVRDISSRNNSLTAGDIGFRYVLRALEENGKNDLIYDMIHRDDVPGYGYQLKMGATALTESWQALPNVSNNHLMLGHALEWFYNGVCGIQQSKDGIAYNKIEFHPQLVKDIYSASAIYLSPYGEIVSNWQYDQEDIGFFFKIPPNTIAKIFLPGRAPFSVGSGEYKYTIPHPKK